MATEQPISQHPHNRAKYTQQLGAMVVLVPLIVLAFFAFRGFDPLALTVTIPVIVLILFGTWIIASSAYQLWLRPCVDVLPDGLRYTTRRGTRHWPWETIDEMRAHKPYTSQCGQYGLYTSGKRVLLLDDRFQRGVELVNHTLAAMIRAHKYDDRLQAGETLRAGQLAIRPDGLQVKNRPVIPWSDIRGIFQEKHFQQVRLEQAHGRPVTFPTLNVSNGPLLARFAELTLERLARQPDATPVIAPAPELIAQTGLNTVRSVAQLLLAIAGLGISIVVIVPSFQNAVTYAFVDGGWLLQLAQVLIVPAVSGIVLIREIHTLIENSRLAADQTGLTFATRSGEQFRSWEEIDSIRFAKVYAWFNPAPAIAYRIDVEGERPVLVSNRFRRPGDIGGVALGQHAEVAYPRTRQRFAQGETLSFGPLTVDRQGIHVRAKTFGWSDVRSSDLLRIGNETHLVIYGAGDKQLVTTSIFRVPNVTLLQKLIQEYAASDSPASDAPAQAGRR